MGHKETVDVSIVIVNFSADDFLKKCLQSIFENTTDIKYEIIVVDNNSIGTNSHIYEGQNGIKCIHNKKNAGFSSANNQGIKLSKGKYVVLLNPDTELLNNSFKLMFDFLEDNNSVGIVGPLVYERDGETIQLSCRSFPSFATSFFNRYSTLTRLFPNNQWSKKYLLNHWSHDSEKNVDWVSGCCMMLRPSMLTEIGLLDTKFFMYNEDVDICLRAHANNWQVSYLPDAIIKHYIGGSSKTIEKKMVVVRHKSMWVFYKKHYSKNIFVDALTFVAILIRTAVKIIVPERVN